MQGDELETLLLGAPCSLNRDEAAAAAGVPEPEARAIWVSLGFPEVAEGERAFTTLDVEALRTALRLIDSGAVDASTVLVLARAMGQGLSRLAEGQVDVFRRQARGMPVEDVLEAVGAQAGTLVPDLERLVVHVWRRQFAAAVGRGVASLAGRDDGQVIVAVGFVDLVEFTRSTREWDLATLERTLERFEAETSARVTAAGGRVVKTLGDEVLYVCDEVLAGAEVALATVAAHEADDDLPRVRAGLALGPVLVRLGDVFGEPVNLASRLTDEARPGTVLVDDAVAAELAEDPSYVLKHLRRRSVRGYRSVQPHLLTRAST